MVNHPFNDRYRQQHFFSKFPVLSHPHALPFSLHFLPPFNLLSTLLYSYSWQGHSLSGSFRGQLEKIPWSCREFAVFKL